MRAYRDPEQALSDAIQNSEVTWEGPPSNNDPRTLIENVSAHLPIEKKILIILDRFEEFIILNEKINQPAFAEFLIELAERPLPNVVILLVLRTEYMAAAPKIGLPKFVDGENWHEVEPFLAEAAEDFLRRSGKNYPDSMMAEIMKGLRVIEDLPGLYRPITLNMVGLATSRMGKRLTANPKRLIQKYVEDRLQEPRIRDEAPVILRQMLGDPGLHRGWTESEIAELTKLEQWRIAGCMVRLARHGLVRTLEGSQARWEIAHSFLVRLIGDAVGGRPPLWRRVLPWASPAILGLWLMLVLTILLLRSHLEERERNRALEAQLQTLAVRNQLEDMGFDVEAFSDGSGFSIEYHYGWERVEISGHETLSRAVELLQELNGALSVDLSGSTINEISALSQLGAIKELTLWNTEVDSIDALEGLSNLRTLDLRYTFVDDLSALKGLHNLRDLDIGYTHVEDLDPLQGLDNLANLDLQDTDVKDFSPLGSLAGLEHLNLSDTEISNLGPLARLEELKHLEIAETKILDLSSLREFTNLEYVKLGYMSIDDFTPLQELTNLEHIDFWGAEFEIQSPAFEISELREIQIGRTSIDQVVIEAGNTTQPIMRFTHENTATLD